MHAVGVGVEEAASGDVDEVAMEVVFPMVLTVAMAAVVVLMVEVLMVEVLMVEVLMVEGMAKQFRQVV